MGVGGEEQTDDFFESLREKSATEVHRQWERMINQDWWTISKMLMVFSVLLIFISAFSVLLDALISAGMNTLESSNLALLLSAASLAVTLLSPTIFFLVLAVILGAVALGASIATGNSEVIYLERAWKRYVVHFIKLGAALTIFVGYHRLLFKDMQSSILEFIFIMFGVTGLMLLPFGLLCWGIGGLWRERKYR